MPKVRMAELSFLYATGCLVLFYISPKYHRNIPKGIRVTERTQNLFFSNKTKGDNSKSKKARVVNLVCDTSSHPDLHFYQASSKYSKGYSSYRADKKFYADVDANRIGPKNNMSPCTSPPPLPPPPPFGRGRYIISQVKLKKSPIANSNSEGSDQPALHSLFSVCCCLSICSTLSNDSTKQEAHGPWFAHLSDIATADMQMLCNIFPILSSQLMKISSFEQFLVLKKNIWV